MVAVASMKLTRAINEEDFLQISDFANDTKYIKYIEVIGTHKISILSHMLMVEYDFGEFYQTNRDVLKNRRMV